MTKHQFSHESESFEQPLIMRRDTSLTTVETLEDGYHKKIPLPQIPAINQVQAHSAQVQLYRTMLTGPRYKHIPHGTTHIPHVTTPTVHATELVT